MEHYKPSNITNIDRNMIVHCGLEQEKITFVSPQIQTQPLKIACFGYTPPCPSYHIKRDKCGYYILEYVLSGKGTIINNGEIYQVEAGDTYLLQPGSIHEYFSDPQEPYEKYWINFRWDIFEQVLKAYQIDQKTVFKHVDLKKSFLQIFSMETDPTENEKIYCEVSAVLFDAAMKCVRGANLDQEENGLAHKLKTLLDVAITKHDSLDVMAKKLFVSKSYLIREFKQTYQCTPHEYLIQKRISLAKHLLQNSHQSISEIAEILCFSDQHYFSNLFKQKVGVSPTQFRSNADSDNVLHKATSERH